MNLQQPDPSDAAYVSEYHGSPALQAEFSSAQAYAAYRRAEARGACRILGASARTYQRPERQPAPVSSRADAADDPDPSDAAYVSKYRGSPALQAEFSSAQAYAAYRRAEARGACRILGSSARTYRQPEDHPTPASSSRADAADDPEPAGNVVKLEPRRRTAFDLIASQPWAMLPGMLDTMLSIGQRENEPLEALEARLGRPLQNAQNVMMRDGVAVIPVTGPVFRYANLFTSVSGATSLDVLATDFTRALDDPAVKAIVLNLNTPGGQASGISEFAAMVRSAGKPVVAYAEQAASAGYWIASAAREVVVGNTGEVGSVGAVIALDTRQRDGEIRIVSSQSPRKRPDVSTDEGRAQLQAHVDRWAQAFIEDVAKGRRVSVDTVQSRFGQGGMLMGRDAVAAGMADRVATLESVIAGLAGRGG